MEYIVPVLDNIHREEVLLNKLAVPKQGHILYFWINTTKAAAQAADLQATDTDITLTIVTASGLAKGDYFKIGTTGSIPDSEVFRVKSWTTGDTVMIASRAQLGSVAQTHTKDDDIFSRQDGFTNTQLGAGTALIAESTAVYDLHDAQYYDLNLEVQCVCDQDYTSDTITLGYAFSSFNDITIGTINTEMTNVANTLDCVFPNNDTLYYATGNFKPTARYMYIWVIGHADLDDAQTTAKIRLNVV